MKHYGDITQIKGSEVPIVDIVTGGSPCQDLSVAGKRAGLAGERSGLFMEQIRVIKEMRDYDRSHRQGTTDGRSADYIRPRYMVWENVPGAFSSNKGEDFRAVLEETAKVAEGDACIPGPPNGRWPHAGCIVGDGWSIAWRVHDAQFWGVPQRRKRISLVADFGGESAPEILFEREGVPGDSSESGKQGQDIATDAGDGVTESSRAISFQERAGKPGGGKGILIQDEHTGALSTLNNQSVCYSIGSNNSEGMKSDNPTAGIHEADTARSLDSSGGNPACYQGGIAVVVENHPQDSRVRIREDGTVQTLNGKMGTGGGNVPMVMEPKEPISIGNGQLHDAMSPSIGVSKTLNCMDDPAKVMVYELDRASFNQGKNAKYDFSIEKEKIGAQVARGPGAVCCGYIVRRLTPLECERLQGFPDGWTDIGDWVDSKGKKRKGESDSPRYKALGNSIALPFWEWMAERMVKYIDHKPTMASLFDGISGFCLVFARVGVRPVFSSEIEEFPIAVAKKHFGDDDTWEVGDYEQYL